MFQLIYIVGIARELHSSGDDAVPIDFMAFWAAAKIALAGNAEQAFSRQTLVSAVSFNGPSGHEWLYPPLFHLVVTPFGLTSFPVAFGLFSAIAFGIFVAALRVWRPERLTFAVTAPPVLFVLVTGNVSLLWGGGLLAALRLRARPVLAGAIIGLLTIKPQLGILLPIALLFGRYWALTAWSAAWSLVLAGLALAVFGWGYGDAFLNELRMTSADFAADERRTRTMISVYAFLRQSGVGHNTALTVQLAAGLAAAAVVARTWSGGRPLEAKIAILCLATLLATPYAFQYELVLAVLAAVFMPRLAPVWLLPVPGWLIGGLDIADYAAPLLAVALCVACFGNSRDGPAAPVRPGRSEDHANGPVIPTA